MAPKRIKKPKAKANSQTFYFAFMAEPIPISLTEEEITIDMHIMQSLLVAQQEAVKRASVERKVAAQAQQQQAQLAAQAHAASLAAARPAAHAPAAQPARMDSQHAAAAYTAALQAAQAATRQQVPPAKAQGVASPCTMQQLQQLPPMQPAGLFAVV